MRSAKKTLSVIEFIRNSGYLLLTVCIVGEIIFFCNLPNVCGCFMSFISWWIFSKFFLKRNVILEHPFSWLFYLSMVLYRFLPLIATFFEWKPITYGFEEAYYTIWGELLLFLIQSLAFYIVCYGRQNVFMTLRRLMQKMDFYTSFRSRTIWLMGFVGLGAMVINMSSGGAEYGDVGGKLIAPLSAMKYIPLVMFFPALYKVNGNAPSKKILWIYLLLLELFSLAGNSREALVHPIGVWVVLLFLNLVRTKADCRKYIYTWKFPIIIVSILLVLKVFTLFSNAMLVNRNIRGDVSALELLQSQVSSIGKNNNNEESDLISYSQGWDETYVDNFLLNRYCNMRITDETLYYAMRLKGWDTYGNQKMRDMFFDRVLANLPTPVLHFLSINIDKKNIAFSEGDILYSTATDSNLYIGYRVASHLALGLACFGLIYFPIQFLLLLLSFYLMDTLVLRRNGILFSLAGLAIGFELVGRFRNANGCVSDANYLVRGYWQFLFLNWVTFKLTKIISNINR